MNGAHDGGAKLQNEMVEKISEQGRRLVEATRAVLKETEPRPPAQPVREQPRSTPRPETPADRWRRGER